jgi:osmotically inducible lipoprotein OsmB
MVSIEPWETHMKRFTTLIIVLMLAALVSGCATPLGQLYGERGALGGAAIGGVAGGLKGAIIGGAAGALGGGLLGDHQQIQLERDRRHYAGGRVAAG